MNKKYKISLTPVNRFYFGGETSVATDNETEKANSSYIVSSNCFPQQTSLLGMMRYLILEQNGLLDNGKIKEIGKEWIGENSFATRNNGGENEYGKIKRLSSCCLQICKREVKKKEKGEDEVCVSYTRLFPAPLDRDWRVDFLSPSAEIVDVRVEGVPYINGGCVCKLPVIYGYDPKDSKRENMFIGERYVLRQSEIFKEDFRVGIRRDNKTGRTLDDAYYKQGFYRFAEIIKGEQVEIGFVFEVVVQKDAFQKESFESIVQLGGDGSRFRLEAECTGEVNEGEKFAEKLPSIYWGNNKSGCYSKAVLLADSYLVRPECLFDISETKSFRFLTTNISMVSYDQFKGENTPSKREKYNLYQQGSVFYFDTKKQQDEFENKILFCKEFVQIGYNNYKIIKY